MNNKDFTVLLCRVLAVALLYPLLRYIEASLVVPIFDDRVSINIAVIIGRSISLSIPSIILWSFSSWFVRRFHTENILLTSFSSSIPLVLIALAAALLTVTFGELVALALKTYFAMKGAIMNYGLTVKNDLVRIAISSLVCFSFIVSASSRLRKSNQQVNLDASR